MVFEKYDKFRDHPKLNFLSTIKNPRQWKHFWPGAGWGVAAFLVYVVYEKVSGNGSGHGHGHGSHGGHGKHH
ncbi:hypothetical protein ABK040_014583 [Willaertia magna]